jgi:predicted DCC family thiol-disulfide oxidoreductase YuxK
MLKSQANVSSILLYDADCGFCQRWCQWAIRHGAEPAVRFEPCQPSVDLRQRAGISETDCGHAAFLVEVADDGRVIRTRRAAGAINGVMAKLPGVRNLLFRVASVFYQVPGLRQLEELGYRWVARNRHRFGSSSCRIGHDRNNAGRSGD